MQAYLSFLFSYNIYMPNMYRTCILFLVLISDIREAKDQTSLPISASLSELCFIVQDLLTFLIIVLI